MLTLIIYVVFFAQGAVSWNSDIAMGLALFDLIFIGLIMDGIKEAGDSVHIEEMSEYNERRSG